MKKKKESHEAFESKYLLTPEGIKKCNIFIKECEAKRKEILDAGLDTAEDTSLPTIEDIISEIRWFMDSDGDYFNHWGVTDNYNSDRPLGLTIGKDFISYSQRESTCRTLEDILHMHFGCEKPFLDEIEELEDGGRNPFTKEGAEAYGNLIEVLYTVGRITGIDVENVVETLDDITNEY